MADLYSTVVLLNNFFILQRDFDFTSKYFMILTPNNLYLNELTSESNLKIFHNPDIVMRWTWSGSCWCFKLGLAAATVWGSGCNRTVQRRQGQRQPAHLPSEQKILQCWKIILTRCSGIPKRTWKYSCFFYVQ